MHEATTAPLALQTTRKGISCDHCPSFCTSLFRSLSDPMMCLISSRADLALKSHSVMSSAPADETDTQFNELFSTLAILIVFSRHLSSASCVVTATADGVVFPEILLGTCCPAVLDCSPLKTRGSLFVVILRLLSGANELGCLALVSICTVFPHRNIATDVILAACSKSHPGWVLSSPLSSRRQCWCSGRCLRCRWVALLNLMILRKILERELASPVLCPAQFSSWGSDSG